MAKSKKPFFEINEHIKASELRLVGEDAAQIGVMSLEEALKLAKEKEVDVVMVSPQAKPPVAKLIDFAKFKYQQKQKHKGSKKTTKAVDIKEIRFTPFIAQGDYQMRINKARDFLEDGDKVRLNVKFTGRQITRKQFGRDLLDRAIEELKDLATIEREPSFQGKILSAQLQPK